MLAVVGVRAQPPPRLPTAGKIIVGRAPDCDVVIDDASVSRHHAEIDLGPPVTIRDLGSSNGTRLRRSSAGSETAELFDVELSGDQRLPIKGGEPMSLGSVLVFVRQAEIAPTPPRQLRVIAAPEMIKVMELATRIARGPVAVLLTGETGVGKEVIAHAIHESSPRAARPFVPIHCAALPEAFAERELFGHEAGAFAGATESKAGLFETAEGGTVFLDEIAELSPSLQTKLLRIVEDKLLLRLGSTTPRPIDIRILSATNRNLEALVAAGQF